MNNRPEFTPERSDAVRQMLVDTVASKSYARTPARKRGIAIATAATIVGVLATGTVALALTGPTVFGPTEPTTTTAPPSPTPSATPDPTPTVTAPVPVNPASAPSRVPASCDGLIDSAALEAIAGTTLVPAPTLTRADSPVLAANARAGALTCTWSENGNASNALDQTSVSLTIVPGASESDYASTIGNSAWSDSQPFPAAGSNAVMLCPESSGFCRAASHGGQYAAAITVTVPWGEQISEVSRTAALSTFAGISQQLATWPAPEPLWFPTGGSIAPVGDPPSCENFVDDGTLSGILGTSVTSGRADFGEFSQSLFNSALQSGAFWCSWSAPNRGLVTIAALPGGAVYFGQALDNDSDRSWVLDPSLPGEAYRASYTAQGMGPVVVASVLIDNSWISVSVPSEYEAALPDIVNVVLVNLGAL